MDRLVNPIVPSSLPRPLAVVELLKPITWFAPMWALMCGVVSSGQPALERWDLIIFAILLAGPLVCGTSQAVNDWFDRHVDAINEPGRPIPSGRIPGQWGLYIACIWTGVSLVVSALLGPAVFGATIIGLALAWAYSAPPFRLKLNGWWGNAACAACYEGLAWFTGAAAMMSVMPGFEIIALATLYSVGAHGIMTLNDFKAVEGDTRMGVRSLPVQLGVPLAAKVACIVMAVPQVIVVGLLVMWGAPWYGAAVAALVVVQLGLMARFLTDPKKFAPWYNATGTSLYVIGMLIAAIAIRGAAGGGA